MSRVMQTTEGQWELARIAIHVHTGPPPYSFYWTPPAPGLLVQGLWFSQPTEIQEIVLSHRIIATSDARLVQQVGEDKVDFLSGRYTRWIPVFVQGHVLRVGEQLEVRSLTRHSEPGWVELVHKMMIVGPRQPKPPRPLAPVLDEVTPVSMTLKLPSASELRREKQIADCRRTLEGHAPRRFEEELGRMTLDIHRRRR